MSRRPAAARRPGARAGAQYPRSLLLDEPLGALDARLRKQLQVELKRLQQQVGITFVYVTHDQEEALTMSDRIAVMSNGRIEQVAPPTEIYESPATVFVADFLGVSNLMDAVASGSDATGRCKVKVGGFDCYAGRGSADATGATKVTIRPERVRLEPKGTGGENRIPGTVQRWVYLGNSVQLIVGLATGAKIQALMQNTGEEIPYREGAEVSVHLPSTALRILEDTGAPLGFAPRTEAGATCARRSISSASSVSPTTVAVAPSAIRWRALRVGMRPGDDRQIGIGGPRLLDDGAGLEGVRHGDEEASVRLPALWRRTARDRRHCR